MGNDMTQALRDALTDAISALHMASGAYEALDAADVALHLHGYAHCVRANAAAIVKLDALLARLTSDGDMVLVPRVPTKAMHAAFYDASSRDQRVFPGPSVVWKAMCDAAAPAQPSEGEPR